MAAPYLWFTIDETGRILGLTHTSEYSVLEGDPHKFYVEGGGFTDGSTQWVCDNLYINEGSIAQRPAMEVTHGVNAQQEIVIADVPVGAEVTVYANNLGDVHGDVLLDNFSAEDSDVTIEVGFSGRFTVILEKFPYQRVEFSYSLYL